MTPYLRHNDVIRIIAPAGPIARDAFEAGIRIIESAGLRPRFSDEIFARDRYLAGNDDRRLAELHDAYRDKQAMGVWAARGGYGTLRLLRSLDLPLVRDAQKPIIGFSDITALHCAINRMGAASLHAPVICSLAKTCKADLDLLWDLLFNGPAAWQVQWTTTCTDRAEVTGHLIGGNLSVLTRLLGTPFAPHFENAVLFLEDVGERPYRLDRMLTHMELAGVASKVKAVVLGTFERCEEENAGYTADEVIAEVCGRWGVPVVDGFPAGHGERNVGLPLGIEVKLSVAEGRAWLGGSGAEGISES
jgi:muramoyltetrapeptide carboxypeptidase